MTKSDEGPSNCSFAEKFQGLRDHHDPTDHRWMIEITKRKVLSPYEIIIFIEGYRSDPSNQ